MGKIKLFLQQYWRVGLISLVGLALIFGVVFASASLAQKDTLRGRTANYDLSQDSSPTLAEHMDAAGYNITGAGTISSSIAIVGATKSAPTVTPSGSNLFTNNSFESDPFDTGFTTNTAVGTLTVTSTAQDGVQAAQCVVDGDDVDGCYIGQGAVGMDIDVDVNVGFHVRASEDSATTTGMAFLFTNASTTDYVDNGGFIDVEGFTECYDLGNAGWISVTSTGDIASEVCLGDFGVEFDDFNTSTYSYIDTQLLVDEETLTQLPYTPDSGEFFVSFIPYGFTDDTILLDNLILQTATSTVAATVIDVNLVVNESDVDDLVSADSFCYAEINGGTDTCFMRQYYSGLMDTDLSAGFNFSSVTTSVGTPTADAHATPKSFVDTSIDTVENKMVQLVTTTAAIDQTASTTVTIYTVPAGYSFWTDSIWAETTAVTIGGGSTSGVLNMSCDEGDIFTSIGPGTPQVGYYNINALSTTVAPFCISGSDVVLDSEILSDYTTLDVKYYLRGWLKPN